jgi:hypothetical protein
VTATAPALAVTAQNITVTTGTAFSGVVATFTDTTPGASAGSFTASIDWGDGTTSAGTVTADPKGGFDVTGTHTYTQSTGHTPGDDGNPFFFGLGGLAFGVGNGPVVFTVTVTNSTTSDVASAPGIATVSGGPSSTLTPPNQLFVVQLYQDLLGRLPDVGGLAYWSSLLDQGMGRSDVAGAIEQSQEYRTDVVEGIYQKMLLRRADASGLTTFTGFLANGGTMEQVQELIAGSAEYFQTRGGGQMNGFLQALYTDGLNRGVDATGQAVFGQALAQGVSRVAVAAALFGSDEYRQDLLQGYYQSYLQRQADSGGLAGFMAALGQGVNDQGVIAAIVGSGEYFQRV